MKRIEQIHEWAKELKFSALTADQQEVVLAEMTLDEYEEMHELNASFENLFSGDKTLTPDAHIQVDLREKVAQKVKPVFWKRPIPMYGVLSACASIFIIAAVFFSSQTNDVVVPQNEVVTQVVRDTVYVPQTVVKEVIKEVYIPVEQLPVKSINTQYVQEESSILVVSAATPITEEISKSFGNSKVNSDKLERFKIPM